METGTHSIWVSEQLRELGHEVIVANVRELRAISHSNRKSDTVDAEKIARFARVDPEILRPICHRTVAQQEALTLIRARNLIVRLRTAAVNSVRGLAKPCGYRLPASIHLVLRQALHVRAAAGSGSGARSSTRTDRCDDGEDPAIRPHHQTADGDGVPGDPGSAPGLWRRPVDGADIRSDAGQQGALQAKPGCGLLSRPAAETQPIRGPRPTTWH